MNGETLAEMPKETVDPEIEKYHEKLREQHLERVRTEGFEARGIDVEPEELCENRVYRKVGRSRKHEQCGKPAVIAFSFEGPDNPEGTRVSFCRGCLGQLARDLIKVVELD